MEKELLYVLEVFRPSSESDFLFYEKSKVPFPRFEKGDFLNINENSSRKLSVDYVTYTFTGNEEKLLITTSIFTLGDINAEKESNNKDTRWWIS